MPKFLLSFILSIISTFIFSQSIIRGPYLQTVKSDGIIIKWRTDIASSSAVWFGTSLSTATNQMPNNTITTEHKIALNGLLPNTKYFYKVGDISNSISVADSNHYFITAPMEYEENNIRFWVTGDFGKGNQGQIDTKLSFENLTRTENIDPDFWLWLGDNAYQNGTDSEYQDKVFNLTGYSDVFSWLPFYPSPGNHDYNNIWADNGVLGIPYTLNNISDHEGPYFDIVDVPTQAEVGGFASTNEVFYSFDYGNAHFLSLNSEVYNISNNTVLNLMKTWIHNDLSQNDKDFTVAYWHQPPYSKGSHNSDDFWEVVMKTMREEIVPILEQYNVDLVLCGHSHVYERSFLINGHHGLSSTFNTSTMLIDGSNGNRAQGNAYVKKPFDPQDKGAVFAVVGNSASSDSQINNLHPVMSTSFSGNVSFGSLVVDIYKNELRGRYINADSLILDDFSIVKQNMTISLGNDTTICALDSVLISPTITKGSDSLTYSWYPGNYSTKTIKVSPSSSTYYYLTVFDKISNQLVYDTIVVNIIPVDTNPVITEYNGVLSTTAGFNYRWYLDGVLVPNVTTNSFTPLSQGVYVVEVYNALNCSYFSDEYLFYDMSLTALSNQTTICEGESVILNANLTGGSDSTKVFWQSMPNEPLNFYYTPSASEQIIAEAIDYITGEIEYDTIYITVSFSNINISISQVGDTLKATPIGNYSYRWYNDGTLISGANSNYYIPSNDGNYTVEYTDTNHCKKESEAKAFVFTSLKDLDEDNNFIIIPNPNNGQFSIKTKDTKFSIVILNSLGQKVFEDKNADKTIHLTQLSAGNYIIKINSHNKTYSRDLLIEK